MPPMSAESIRTVTPQAMRDRDAARALTAASGRTERTELSFTAFSSTTSGTRRKRAVATASVARACALLSAFDSRTQTPTGFLNDTAAARKKKKQRPDPLVDDEFVREVFLGLTTEQHRGACDAFVSRFFAARASQVARQDAMMYRVFAYLVFFRLEELTFPEFAVFVEGQHVDKMEVFCRFAFDPATLAEFNVLVDWAKIFSLAHIEGTMFPTLEAHRADSTRLIRRLNAKAAGREAAAEADAEAEAEAAAQARLDRLTVPVAPRLTPAAPRRVPQPIYIAQNFTADDPDELAELHDAQPTAADIAADGAARLARHRTRTLRKYQRSKRQPFDLRVHRIRDTTGPLRAVIEARDQSLLEFGNSYYRPAPTQRPRKPPGPSGLPTLSPKQVAQVRARLKAASYDVGGCNWEKLFAEYDKDESGELDADEVREAIRRSLKLPPSELSDTEVGALCTLFDEDGSGGVSIQELVSFVETPMVAL